MIIYDVRQGTPEWGALRAGIPTASLFDNIMTSGGEGRIVRGERQKPEPKASTSAEPYMNHLLAERIKGAPIDGFKSQWMDRGNQYEARAVASYELDNDCECEKVGFVTTDDGRIGCSPDRFVIRQGHNRRLLEAKAPTLPNHVGYLRAVTGAMSAYKVQLMGQLWVCEADSVDIISYHPDIPKEAQNAVFTVNRDEVFIKELAAHVRAFSNRLEDLAEDFKARGWIKPREEKPAEDFGSAGITDEDLAWAMSRPASDYEDYEGGV